MPLGCLLVLVAFMWTPARSAHAGKFDDTLDFSVHGRASTWRVGGLRLRSDQSVPALVRAAHPRLAGGGPTIDTVLRANLSLHGVRFGIGAGFRGAKNLQLELDPLPAGYDIGYGRVGGVPLEGFVGYAIGSARRVRPFAELRATTTVMVARASLGQRDVGTLSRFGVHGVTFDLVGRAGVLVPLGEYFFLDASVGRTIVGHGGWVASLGLGIPIPTDNL